MTYFLCTKIKIIFIEGDLNALTALVNPVNVKRPDLNMYLFI